MVSHLPQVGRFIAGESGQAQVRHVHLRIFFSGGFQPSLMHCCARHTAQLFKKFREAVVDKVSTVAVATVDVNSPPTAYATM